MGGGSPFIVRGLQNRCAVVHLQSCTESGLLLLLTLLRAGIESFLPSAGGASPNPNPNRAFVNSCHQTQVKRRAKGRGELQSTHPSRCLEEVVVWLEGSFCLWLSLVCFRVVFFLLSVNLFHILLVVASIFQQEERGLFLCQRCTSYMFIFYFFIIFYPPADGEK